MIRFDEMLIFRCFGCSGIVLNVRVLQNFDRADPRNWVRIEHFEKEIHEHGLFVEAIAIVLFKGAREVLKLLILLCQDLFV